VRKVLLGLCPKLRQGAKPLGTHHRFDVFVSSPGTDNYRFLEKWGHALRFLSPQHITSSTICDFAYAVGLCPWCAQSSFGALPQTTQGAEPFGTQLRFDVFVSSPGTDNSRFLKNWGSAFPFRME
jgi:hypothetical protein